MKRYQAQRLRTRQPGVSPKASAGTRRGKTSYKIVAVSLYNQQAESVERAAASLKQAGYLNVSRSFVIQTMIERVLEDKTPAEIVQFFEQRQLRRPLSPARARTDASPHQDKRVESMGGQDSH